MTKPRNRVALTTPSKKTTDASHLYSPDDDAFGDIIQKLITPLHQKLDDFEIRLKKLERK